MPWIYSGYLHLLDTTLHWYFFILLTLSESSASDSYMLCYASAHIFQVVSDVLLGAADSPKTSQGQA